MRLPILSLGAGLLLASAALAQNTGGGGGATLQLPVGQTFKQFEFPVYQEGQLKYTLFAAEATGITLNRAETSNLKIDIYDNGLKTTTITSPKADLYASEQKMRTKNTVQIERADMEATSQDCDFDVKSKKFLLRTKVRVLLKHFDVGGGGQKANPIAKSPAGARVLPAPALDVPPAPSAPYAQGEDALSTPGAMADTNAAPLPVNSSK